VAQSPVAAVLGDAPHETQRAHVRDEAVLPLEHGLCESLLRHVRESRATPALPSHGLREAAAPPVGARGVANPDLRVPFRSFLALP